MLNNKNYRYLNKILVPMAFIASVSLSFPAFSMSYHDNAVSISPTNGLNILNGSYKISDLSITNGQDPDNKNYKNQVVSLKNGQLSFRVGRKGDAKNANWLKSKIRSDQTTFNHYPDKLNFAFIGTLNLTAYYQTVGNVNLSFPDVVLAQGHSDNSNNWWFGGKNCQNMGGNKVSCSGKDNLGATISLEFQRGGNGVSTINVRHSSMTYRDNSVKFTMNENHYLAGGSFKVRDFSVTDGQDPNREIYTNLTVPLQDDNLLFKIGRKGSKKPASWLSKQLKVNQTTFNHPADDLNFALMGALKLDLVLPGSRRESYVFSDVLLAQGHSGERNNWWFGGKNCLYTIDEHVFCHGKDSRGNTATFKFKRGGNDVNEIIVTPSKPKLEHWMSKLSNSSLLSHLSIPGTHNSATYRNGDVIDYFEDIWAQCQDTSIYNQLVDGIRVFDLRVRPTGKSLALHHGEVYLNKMLGNALDEFTHFLSKHPQETIFVRITKADVEPQSNSGSVKENFTTSYWNNSLYKNYFWRPDASASENPKLGDVRGKIVVFPGDGMDGNQGPDWSSFDIQDEYTVTTHFDLETKWKFVLSQLEKTAKSTSNLKKVYVNFTSGVGVPTPSEVADYVNPRLKNKLQSYTEPKRTGIIMMDYPNATEGLVDLIISMNGAKTQPVK